MAIKNTSLPTLRRHVIESNFLEGIKTQSGPLYTQHLLAAIAISRDPARYVYDLPAIHRLLLVGQKRPRRIGLIRKSHVWVMGRQRTKALRMPVAGELPLLLEYYYGYLQTHLFSGYPLPSEYASDWDASWLNLCIHAFEDGNGRVNRLHLNAVRLCLGKSWYVITRKERGSYYKLIRRVERDFFPEFRLRALERGG